MPLADLIPRIPLDGRRPLAADRAQLERLYATRVEAYRWRTLRVTAACPRRASRRRDPRRHSAAAADPVTSRRHTEAVRYLSSATSTPTSRRSTPCCRCRDRRLRRVLCSAISSATAPIRRRSWSASGARAGGDRPRQPRQGLRRPRAGDAVQRRRARADRVDAHSLSPDELRTLAELPKGRGGRPTTVEICHGAPFDEDHYVFDERRRRALASRRHAARICLFGHTHLPAVFTRRRSGRRRQRAGRRRSWPLPPAARR